jgi:hypothetical protein
MTEKPSEFNRISLIKTKKSNVLLLMFMTSVGMMPVTRGLAVLSDGSYAIGVKIFVFIDMLPGPMHLTKCTLCN